MAENVGSIVWTAEMQTAQLVAAEKQVSNSLAKTESSFIAAGKSAQVMNTQVSRAAAGVNQSLGGIGRNAGQASIQIQQFIGQLQGGVSPMVALSQQAADLGFTLDAPLLGAIVSISAALGGMLFNALTAGESKVDDLVERLKDLREETGLTANQAKVLSQDEMDSLQSKYARIEAIKLENFETEKLIKTMSEAGAGLEAENRLSLVGGVPRSADDNLQRYADKLDEAQRLVAKNKAEMDLLSGEIERSKKNIDEYAKGALAAAESQQRIADITKEVADQAAITTEKMLNGDNAARRLAIALQLGLTNAEMLPAPIEKAVSALEKAEAESQKIAKQNQALESAARSWDNLADSIAKQSATAQGAAAANQYQIEQIQLAGQAAGKTAEEIQKLVDSQNALFAAQEANRNAKAEEKRGNRVAEIEQEIYLQQIRNQLGNEQFEIESAIRALGPDSTPEEQQAIADKVTQLQALRFEYELLGATIQESMQGVALNAMDNFSAGLARVITEGDSAREMFGNLAKTIATELLTAIIRYWVGQAAAALVGQTAVTAATVTAGGAAAAAWAPAATLASIATLGGAATVGVAALGTGLTAGVGLAAATQTGSALAAGAGRKNGGPVSAGRIYPVSEGGDPELLMQGGRSYLLPGAGGGNVVSAKDMQVSGGGGNAPIINITNYSGGQASVQSQRFSEQDKRWVLDVVVGDMNKRGATHKAVTGTTNAVNRTS